MRKQFGKVTTHRRFRHARVTNARVRWEKFLQRSLRYIYVHDVCLEPREKRRARSTILRLRTWTFVSKTLPRVPYTLPSSSVLTQPPSPSPLVLPFFSRVLICVYVNVHDVCIRVCVCVCVRAYVYFFFLFFFVLNRFIVGARESQHPSPCQLYKIFSIVSTTVTSYIVQRYYIITIVYS